MKERWITVEIEVPEGYEDVSDELVRIDCMQHVENHGWNWRYIPPEPGESAKEPR